MGFKIIEKTDFSGVKSKFKGCIYFGVPQSKSQLSKSKNGKRVSRAEFTNADILYVLEHGSPARNLPPRPLLSAVLKLHSRELNDALSAAVPLILGGDEKEVDTYFENLALKIQGWVQMYFVREGQLVWKPSLRVLRAKKAGKKARTLIDTGSLRQSVVAFYSKNGSDNF